MYALIVLVFGAGVSQSVVPGFPSYQTCATERDRVAQYFDVPGHFVRAICVRTGS